MTRKNTISYTEPLDSVFYWVEIDPENPELDRKKIIDIYSHFEDAVAGAITLSGEPVMRCVIPVAFSKLFDQALQNIGKPIKKEKPTETIHFEISLHNGNFKEQSDALVKFGNSCDDSAACTNSEGTLLFANVHRDSAQEFLNKVHESLLFQRFDI